MPSLPRIRRSTRTRPGADVVARASQVSELTAGGLTWVNAVGPDLDTAQALAERFGWHPLDVEDVVSKRQRPKVDDYEDEGYLFAVLHFPVYDKAVQRLNAAELDVFIGQDYLVTLPNRELLPVTRLFARCEADEAFREQLLARGSGRLLYEVLDDLFDYCFPILDKIGHKLDRDRGRHVRWSGRGRRPRHLERQAGDHLVSQGDQARALDAARPRAAHRPLPPEDLELYFDDVNDAVERIWDQLDNYKEVVEALESTNESVISHRQNSVLLLLTVISATMLPLTLITGIFGMNVDYPGEGTHDAFWVILLALGATLGAMLGFFRWKRWL